MDVIYFELNNWFSGRDFPEGEPFATWVDKYYFSDETWVKKNKLCVVSGPIDMSYNWCITAPKQWVEENCPKLLSDEKFDTEFIIQTPEGIKREIETYSYKQFLRYPEPDGMIYGRFGWEFLPYKEENIGISFHEDDCDNYDEYAFNEDAEE